MDDDAVILYLEDGLTTTDIPPEYEVIDMPPPCYYDHTQQPPDYYLVDRPGAPLGLPAEEVQAPPPALTTIRLLRQIRRSDIRGDADAEAGNVQQIPQQSAEGRPSCLCVLLWVVLPLGFLVALGAIIAYGAMQVGSEAE